MAMTMCERPPLKWAVTAALALQLFMTGCMPAVQANGPIASVGYAIYGGERTARPAAGVQGDIADWILTKQVSVLSLQPAAPNPGPPIVIMPGFGLAADSYLETPDGREGWAMDFVRRGYPVYLVEPSHTTRSGIDTGFYLKEGEPAKLFSWGGEHAWARWGLGPEPGVAYADSRFPLGAWEKVVGMFAGVEAPEISGGKMVQHQVDANIAGLNSLLAGRPPAVILAHSAAGVSAFAYAARHPNAVAAIIVVEPVGCPPSPSPTPVLAVFADHLDTREQMMVRAVECKATVEATKLAGISADYWNLPGMGITGNSHLLMMELNSNDLSKMIADWIEKNVR